jgi:alcohol dehydrogenase (cytochrome c)
MGRGPSARATLLVLSVSLASAGLSAQVTYDRLLKAASEPQDWLTYSGTFMSQRYSQLTQITPANVKNLQLKWMYQGTVFAPWQATPLVVDGIMYLTQRPNDVVALDARTGRAFWIYQHLPARDAIVCCGANNRGVAILGDTLFFATHDARVIAIHTKTGQALWNVEVANRKEGAYSMTLSPLVIKDKVIVGTGGSDFGVRGFISALDAKTGKEAWRFYTIPAPGEPGHETWAPCPPSSSSDPASPSYCDRNAWKSGGGAIWVTGSYDPELNLTYWGTGNPGPDYNPRQRPGDNLYSGSVIALDADTGKLKWYFQFVPGDPYDYDAVQIPVLADMEWEGRPRKLMLWGNRNGFFYVLDRATGEFLLGKPFVHVNWASGLDKKGRPIPTPQPAGKPTYPGPQGATNWHSPSYSPRTGLFYLPVWENYGAVFEQTPQGYEHGAAFGAGGSTPFVPIPGAPGIPMLRRGPINFWTEAAASGAVLALDARTGERRWKFPMTDVGQSGILTTASDVLFTGGREGYFQALHARTGEVLWKVNLGAQGINGPITYEVGGKQYVATISGLSLATFGLPD